MTRSHCEKKLWLGRETFEVHVEEHYGACSFQMSRSSCRQGSVLHWFYIGCWKPQLCPSVGGKYINIHGNRVRFSILMLSRHCHGNPANSTRISQAKPNPHEPMGRYRSTRSMVLLAKRKADVASVQQPSPLTKDTALPITALSVFMPAVEVSGGRPYSRA